MALAAAGVDARLTETPLQARAADWLIVPDADDDDASLARGLSDEVLDAVRGHVLAERPLLVVGGAMHWLLGGRTHAGLPPSLDVFAASVSRFDHRITDDGERPLLVPHVGFSFVVGLDRHPVLQSVVPKTERGAWLYFRHRLCAPARVPKAEVAVCHHGVPFAGAIWRGPTLAMQFVPELSGPLGLSMLAALYASIHRGKAS